MNYKHAITEILTPVLPELKFDELLASIEEPPDHKMGHYAFPCFRLAKALRKAPPAIAGELAERLNSNLPGWLAEAKATGPYINFFLQREEFAKITLKAVAAQREGYGRTTIGAGKTIAIDYSSPNIAKPFHVGHLGTTVIGRALYNIFASQGYKVIGINYLGDWGTSFGKLLTAYLKWGDKNTVEEHGLEELSRLYVKFNRESKDNPSLNDEARSIVVQMEQNNEEMLSLWRWLKDISMREYKKVYDRLGIDFESYNGESYYNDKIWQAVDRVKASGIVKTSEGAQIIDLEEYNMPPCIIVRSDGGTVYATRDLAAAMERYESFNFDKCLYVTASEQKLHFAQFFKVLELMNLPWAKNLVHVPYGLFVFEGGKMSSREGGVIKLKDLLDEAAAKTLAIIEEKNPNLANKSEVAEQVGIGAILFNEMYNSRIKDVFFSWDKMLNFEGETAPYVQYAHARACSLLEKGGASFVGDAPLRVPQHTLKLRDAEGGVPYDALSDDESFAVLRLLYNFPDRIAEAAEKYEPYIISRFLVALSQAFNKFYNTHTILTNDASQEARLLLVDCVRLVIAAGLKLLGISAPQKM